jgi:hypothetical protein
MAVYFHYGIFGTGGISMINRYFVDRILSQAFISVIESFNLRWVSYMRRIARLAPLLLAGAACAHDPIERNWLQEIQSRQQAGCNAQLSKVESAVIGNNGMRSEVWLVTSCNKQSRYTVQYWPPAFFPDRASPYVVTEPTDRSP